MTFATVIEFINPIANSSVVGLVNAVASWLFRISIPIAVVMIIYAGVLMMTAQGKKERFELGKQVLRDTVIGLVVIFISGGIFTFVNSVFEKFAK